MKGDSPRRHGEDRNHIQSLAEMDGQLPPLVVQRSSMRVIDGMHRLRAAQLCGKKEIEVRFFDGDEASAFVLAVKANITHGLPLCLADRKAAAAKIVGFYPRWSDRMIASLTGLSATTVAAVRKCPSDESGQLDVRVGRDGKQRPVNAAQRRNLAKELIEKSPGASLREIARQARLSPETVRRIRTDLAQTQDPAKGSWSELNGGQKGEAFRPSSASSSEAGPKKSGQAGSASSMLQALRADPSLRSSERGRALLRLLACCEVIDEHGTEILQAVPPHCIARVAEAASSCVEVWERFAMRAEEQAKFAVTLASSGRTISPEACGSQWVVMAQ
jgi:hypothetical protein